MSDIASLVERYLSNSAKRKRLNFYTVLGLDELSDDRAKIVRALDSAIEKLKSADRTTDPAGFEQIVKVVRQARTTLLDEEKKRVYDAQLSRTIAKSSAKDTSIDLATDELSRWLPKGDPSAPFLLSDFLKLPVETLESETVAQRREALAELSDAAHHVILPSSASSAATVGPTNSSASNFQPHLELRPASNVRNTGRELQEMIRRNRRKKNQIVTGAAIGSSLVVVLIGAWMFVANRMEWKRQISMTQHRASLAEAIETAADTAHVRGDARPESNQESGAARMNLGTNTGQAKERIGVLPKIGGDEATRTADDNSKAGDAQTPPAKAPEPMIDTPPASVPEPTTGREVTEVPKMTEDPAPAMEKKADGVQWKQAILAARQAIDGKDFERFAIEIEKALNLTGNDLQEAQSRRLDQFGQLYQKGLGIVNESLSELKALQEIRYGSTGRASVVELKSNALILRIAGKNETYAHDKLPMGILLALVEPKLNDSAIDQAIRGILCSTDPRSNPATKKQAKAFFDKAAALDERFAKLDQVLQDNYQ